MMSIRPMRMSSQPGPERSASGTSSNLDCIVQSKSLRRRSARRQTATSVFLSQRRTALRHPR
eukprot:4176609-Pyramimonas_sp.AAC.1